MFRSSVDAEVLEGFVHAYMELNCFPERNRIVD